MYGSRDEAGRSEGIGHMAKTPGSTMPKRRRGEPMKDYAKRVNVWLRGEDIPHVQHDLAKFKTATFHLNREK
jgi:hypothetical protein